MSSRSVDYYAALGVSASSTQDQIRAAYKRAALKTHPDRVAHDDPTRAQRTKKFQQVNDAYYVLSDPSRRREYDASRSGGSFRPAHGNADAQFSDIFEEMMEEEGLGEGGGAAADNGGAGGGSLWGTLGGVSGGVMGFILGNVPGALAGMVAGNRLGNIRDRKGKAVYEVFQELPQSDKAKLLSDLAAKVLAHAVS